jgi:hypothetical protein
MDCLDENWLLRVINEGFTEDELQEIENRRVVLLNNWLESHRQDFASDEEAEAYYFNCQY